MALEERISEHLGEPYVYLREQRKFLCKNGVLFTVDEYKNGIDINAEYERRLKEDTLYDYAYAKSTGLLRKKKGQGKTAEPERKVEGHAEEHAVLPERPAVKEDRQAQAGESKQERAEEDLQGKRLEPDEAQSERKDSRESVSVMFIIGLLTVTTFISGYISTLHTATYLYDYVDVISAWLMSLSVTAYNATAFEVSVLFKKRGRFGLTFVFILLWGMVTLFSMATTVSVFYDRFSFTETQITEENHKSDSNKLRLDLLSTKEKDLREAIMFKKKDIEYRQEHEFATTAVRKELNELQNELQKVLSEQEKILSETPEVAQGETKRKESLFSFLGRLIHVEGGVLEFIMSTLSAVFVNLIAPLSLVAVAEIKRKGVDKIKQA
jgi:hypothetical protein